MRQPVILQVHSLGVPVLISGPTETPDLRWSSDPDISPNAPAYLFRDASEIRNFLTHGIDRRFISESSLETIRVEAPDSAICISREEAINFGADNSSWDLVRVGLIVTGNASTGPVSDAFEWMGERAEYDEGAHMMEAFQFARKRGITGPIIVPHNESAHTMNAAQFMTDFHRTIKPQLLNAHQVLSRLSGEILAMDLGKINPNRAHHILLQVQTAIADQQTQDNLLRQNLGMEVKVHPAPVTGPEHQTITASTEQVASNHAVSAPPTEPDPQLFRSPRMG
ncbi:hypothetical protein HX878_22395 [Pseudomonas veronii]|uniref:hypothetical protein n=1 Tax=Pseudomonas veronii TaxID=76761 RepID=UPI0015A45A95|nr:hypothetical protein [Pseudomonas veronii]NWD57478.1 hypothetical protein [Pseudomonas veronii]